MNKSKIAVLMSSYNGEKYIEEQIESIIEQENVVVDLFIRDDGSTDKTKEIITRFQSENIHINLDDNIGVVKSFFELIKTADGYDYYALCDQDDVWDKDKLYVAIKHIKEYSYKPSLYFSTTRVVDDCLNLLENRCSTVEEGVYDSVKVLVGNNATGCTMVFNSKLRNMVITYFPNRIIMHDHWIYFLCIMCGGYLFFDKTPHISYRQHGNNELGNNIPFRKRISMSSFKKGKRIRSEMSKQLYEHYKGDISKNNKELLFCSAYYSKNKKNKIKLINYLRRSNLSIKRKFITIIEVLLGFY